METNTIQRIDRIISRINTHPEYSDCVSREKRVALRDDAAKHSFGIENFLSNKHYKKKRKSSGKSLDNLRQAWDFLASEGIDLHTISKLGRIIAPIYDHGGAKPCPSPDGFRTTELNFGGFAAPEPKSVPQLVNNLIHFLDNINLHPILKGINTHIDLVKIHPYVDGNGRAARLLQNFYLEGRGYPVAVIPDTEDNIYRKLMKGVLKDRYDGKSNIFDPSDAEGNFIEYVSSKILSSAEVLEDELQRRRGYEIFLTKLGSPGVPYSIAKVLRGYSKKHGNMGVSVSIDKKSGNRGERLEVIGDIGETDLDHKLRDLSVRFDFKYQLHRKKGC